MAKPEKHITHTHQASHQGSHRPTPRVEVDDDEELKPSPRVEEVEETITTRPQVPRPGDQPVLKAADLVTINMFVDVDPSPIVGHPNHGGYSFLENGISKLEARKSYVVPANVAAHLADKKMCSVSA